LGIVAHLSRSSAVARQETKRQVWGESLSELLGLGSAINTLLPLGPHPVNGCSVTGTVISGLGKSTPRMSRMVEAANWRFAQERQFVLAK
jgi:hypothetical protein